MPSVTESLKLLAIDEGFDLVGVAASGPATSYVNFTEWLARGMHGGMSYLSRTEPQRSNPEHLLSGCRSVVAVAMSYRTDHPSSLELKDPDRAWISRYAWGRDYHKLLRRRLIRIGRWLGACSPGCAWRVCVDAAPVLEREWAARAGIGWIGKSSMLLNRRLGSELFLGLLLTDLELVPDLPTTSHCGRCTACLDACPTSALVAPGLLDARLCIAYLTIEHRGAIDPEQQISLGHHVAGCDICNEVCPFTQRAPAGLHPELEPAPHRLHPRVRELQALDEAGWKLWRQGSALNRIPFAELQRNASIVGANLEGAKLEAHLNTPAGPYGVSS